MQFYPQSSAGFVIDHELAEVFGLEDEFLVWESDWDDCDFIEEFEAKYGLLPDSLKWFEYEHGGYIQGLEGFEYDAAYVLFDETLEEQDPEKWQQLVELLEEHDVSMDTGTWSEMG